MAAMTSGENQQYWSILTLQIIYNLFVSLEMTLQQMYYSLYFTESKGNLFETCEFLKFICLLDWEILKNAKWLDFTVLI